MPVLELSDGRLLEHEVSGPEGGRVLLFHHGTPGSAHQLEYLAEAVHRRGWRLVTLSRPGSAGSTRLPGRLVADVVPDAVAVLDVLGVDRFVVAGASGGGPHALACGALLPERVDAVLAICSVAPYDADGLDFLAGMGDDNVTEIGLALDGEAALRPWLDEHLPGLRTASPEQIFEELATILPEVDRACLRGGVGEQLARSMHSAASGSSDGWLDDDLAFTRPWGFDVADIRVPVSLWQGTADLMVPFPHGQWLAAHVPGVRPHLEQGEGHLSITVGAVDRMLDELDQLAG